MPNKLYRLKKRQRCPINALYRTTVTLPRCARTLTNALETLSEKAFQRIYTSDLATDCFKSEGHDFADFKGLPGKMKNQNSHCGISELDYLMDAAGFSRAKPTRQLACKNKDLTGSSKAHMILASHVVNAVT